MNIRTVDNTNVYFDIIQENDEPNEKLLITYQENLENVSAIEINGTILEIRTIIFRTKN